MCSGELIVFINGISVISNSVYEFLNSKSLNYAHLHYNNSNLSQGGKMGKIIIGILFIIGGLSGEFVLRGTESGEALAVVGVILIVIGVVQMARSDRKGGVDSIEVKPAGTKNAFDSIENPSQTINFKAYDINSKHYIGKIVQVNETEKTLTIKNDFGKEQIKEFSEIEILEEELRS